MMTPIRTCGIPSRKNVMPVLVMTLCLIGLNLVTTRALATGKEVELLVPRSGAQILAGNPETHLVIREAGPPEKAITFVTKGNQSIIPVVSIDNGSDTFLHFRVPLDPGKNIFILRPGGEEIELKFEQIQSDYSARDGDPFVFHQGDGLPKSCLDCHDLEISADLHVADSTQQTSCASCHINLFEKNNWRHSTTENRQCLKCHLKSSEPVEIGFPTVKLRDICLNCHASKKKWFSRQAVHGVIELGGCTLCHDPHGDRYRYQLWAEGSLNLCLGCHDDMQNLVSGKNRLPHVHDIIFGQGCTACHDPHATENKFMLKRPINELCLGCHQRGEQFSSGHPVPRHPVSASRDFLRRGRQLTCTSCHDPHGAAEPYMMITTVQGGRLCRECHSR